jgi:serine/threonine protein kinase
MAVYFLIEILTLVEALHSINIIHADIKADNFLLQVHNWFTCIFSLFYSMTVNPPPPYNSNTYALMAFFFLFKSSCYVLCEKSVA